jgi:hypothetical protein
LRWNDDILRAHDEQAMRERLASFIAAGESSAALRRKAAEAAMKRLQSGELKPIYDQLLAYGNEYASLVQELSAGQVSAPAARRQLRKHWTALDRLENRQWLRTVFDEYERNQETTSLERLQALLGKELADRAGTTRRDWFGEYMHTPDPEPQQPGSADGGDVGTVRQGLDGVPSPPYTDCASAFDLSPRTAQSHDGPGVSIITATAGPGGNFFTHSGAFLMVLGGVGVQTQAAVGRSLTWGSGYSTLTVRATIDFSLNLYGHMVGVGLSTCSSELFVEVLVDNGASVRSAMHLGALTAPVAWGAEWKRRDQVVLTARATLPPGGGRARLYAGAVSSAATGGAAFSAACWALNSGTVRSICADLS